MGRGGRSGAQGQERGGSFLKQTWGSSEKPPQDGSATPRHQQSAHYRAGTLQHQAPAPPPLLSVAYILNPDCKTRRPKGLGRDLQASGVLVGGGSSVTTWADTAEVSGHPQVKRGCPGQVRCPRCILIDPLCSFLPPGATTLKGTHRHTHYSACCTLGSTFQQTHIPACMWYTPARWHRALRWPTRYQQLPAPPGSPPRRSVPRSCSSIWTQ